MAGIDLTMAEDEEFDRYLAKQEEDAERELARQERQIKHEANIRRLNRHVNRDRRFP